LIPTYVNLNLVSQFLKVLTRSLILICFTKAHSVKMTHFTVQSCLTSPCQCTFNVVSAIVTKWTSLKQIIKIRDLVNTFKNWGTKFKFKYKNWDQINNLTNNEIHNYTTLKKVYILIFFHRLIIMHMYGLFCDANKQNILIKIINNNFQYIYYF